MSYLGNSSRPSGNTFKVLPQCGVGTVFAALQIIPGASPETYKLVSLLSYNSSSKQTLSPILLYNTMETVNPAQTSGGDAGGNRPYRSKGPTLGKGKACEACRARRIRCNGVRPTCTNCAQSDKECVYLDKPRPPSSAVALSARLASLEERYRTLSEVEATRRTPEGAPAGLVFDAGMALNWMGILDFSQLPPPNPTVGEVKSDALDDPYLEATMTSAERKLMIDLYFRECYRYNVSVKPSRLLESLEDPDHSRRPHPCLFNAMLLVSYDFAVTFPMEPVLDESGARFLDFKIPTSLPSSDVLLARAQAHCEQSLAAVDRLQDYIQASLLLSNWFFRQGRLMSGQYSMAAVTRLVINCKLHRIDNDVLQEMAPGHEPPPPGLSRWDGTLLDRPKSVEELAMRIGMFWQAFYGDKCRALMTGLPPALDDNDTAQITSVWPREMDEYISGSAFMVPYTSYSNLFDGSVPYARPIDRPFTILFKCAAILDRAIKLISTEKVPAQELEWLRKSMNHVSHGFNTLFEEAPLSGVAPYSRMRSFCEVSFKSLIQMYLLVGEMQFTHIKTIGAEEDESALYEVRLAAGRQCAKRIGETMEEMEFLAVGTDATKRAGVEHMCYMAGLLLSSASSVLIEHNRKLQGQVKDLEGDETADAEKEKTLEDLKNEIKIIESDLETLVEAVDRIRETYPVVDVLLARVKRMREGGSSEEEETDSQ